MSKECLEYWYPKSCRRDRRKRVCPGKVMVFLAEFIVVEWENQRNGYIGFVPFSCMYFSCSLGAMPQSLVVYGMSYTTPLPNIIYLDLLINKNCHKFVTKETNFGTSFVTTLLSRTNTEINMNVKWKKLSSLTFSLSIQSRYFLYPSSCFLSIAILVNLTFTS